MRIQRLQLENFRGFTSLDLDLSQGHTTVLVGANGSGKTAVLKALSRLMGLAAERIGLYSGAQGLSPAEVRAGSEGCAISGEFLWQVPTLVDLDNEPGAPAPGPESFSLHTNARHLHGGGWEQLMGNLSAGKAWIRRWHDALKRGRSFDVPMVAEFWIDRYSRARSGDSSLAEPHLPQDPLTSYAGLLSHALSNRDEFLQWFRLREDLENERFRDRRDYIDPQLDAVRRALKPFLQGYEDLRVRRRPMREAGAAHVDFLVESSGPVLTLRKGDTLLAFTQLSDGEQGLLVLVGDIARRLAITHPGLADPLQGRGIVLIDEVELHLHPRWQRTLIPNLKQAFPNLQFIVTTHSPQVLSLVPREQVKILRDFEVVEDPPHTLGRDSNAILYEVMGVEQYPPFAAEKVRTVARLIDEERWPEAREALAELAQDFGPNDAEVVRLGSMMEFLSDDETPG